MAMRVLLESRGSLTRCGNSCQPSICPSALRNLTVYRLARSSVVGRAAQLQGRRQESELKGDTFIEGGIAAPQGKRLCLRVCGFKPPELPVTNALCAPWQNSVNLS